MLAPIAFPSTVPNIVPRGDNVVPFPVLDECAVIQSLEKDLLAQRNAIRKPLGTREPLGQRTIRGTLNVRSEDAEAHEADSGNGSGSEYMDEDETSGMESDSQ